MSDAYMPQSESTEWATPLRVFKPIDDEFGFSVDVAASEWNTKVRDRWFSKDIDGLAQPWQHETAWCNPPYGASNIAQWLSKAHRERENGTTTVLLLPNTTDCKWFHAYVWDIGRNRPRAGVELRFVAGRIAFDLPPEMGHVKQSANVKGSILVIIRPSTFTVNLCPTCGHLRS